MRALSVDRGGLMMTLATPVSASFAVRDLAKGIASAIREHGHYQAMEGQSRTTACVVVNPAVRVVSSETVRELVGVIYDVIGCTADARFSFVPLYEWNDSTETAVVLATLDGIANAD